jgi:hypothetical protein
MQMKRNTSAVAARHLPAAGPDADTGRYLETETGFDKNFVAVVVEGVEV